MGDFHPGFAEQSYPSLGPATLKPGDAGRAPGSGGSAYSQQQQQPQLNGQNSYSNQHANYSQSHQLGQDNTTFPASSTASSTYPKPDHHPSEPNLELTLSNSTSYSNNNTSNTSYSNSSSYPQDPSYPFNMSYGNPAEQNSYFSHHPADQGRGAGGQQQQQQHQPGHQGQGPPRMLSDNFGTVGAGPPSPGKMDMLPHAASHPHSYGQSSSGQLKNKGREMGQPHIYNSSYETQANGPLSKAPMTKGSSTTSEFTKRKNWSQRIVEEMQDVLHVLSPAGIFLFASPSVLELTGFSPEELVGRGITDFIDPEDTDNFVADFTTSLKTDTPLTTYIRMRTKNDQSVLFEITGRPYYTFSTANNNNLSTSHNNIKSNGQQGGGVGSSSNDDSSTGAGVAGGGGGGEKMCKCFFAMARLYPGKNNAMLDSFLELKVENERLRQRLAEIYREIEGEPDDAAGVGAGGGASPAALSPASQMQMHNQLQGDAHMSGDGNSGDQQQQQPRQISGFPSRLGYQNNLAQQHPQQQQQLQGQGQEGGQQQQQQQQSAPQYAMSTDDASSSMSAYYNAYPSSSSSNPAYLSQQQGMPGSTSAPGQGQGQGQGQGYADPSQISSLRGAAVNQESGLVSSAGLIPSTSNTYGALGIGISANSANRSQNPGNSSSNHHPSNASQGGAGMGGGMHQGGGQGGGAGMEDGDQGMDGKKKKPKKQRTEEGEFVCRDCGTVDSPEWRRGPLGPKTLCNACGLRWAKKNKQTRQSIGGMDGLASAQ